MTWGARVGSVAILPCCLRCGVLSSRVPTAALGSRTLTLLCTVSAPLPNTEKAKWGSSCYFVCDLRKDPSIVVGRKDIRVRQDAAGHFPPTIRRHQNDTLPTFPFLFSLGPQAMEAATHTQGLLSPLLTPEIPLLIHPEARLLDDSKSSKVDNANPPMSP